MPTYLDRYLAGEHEQVWDELMALGAAVRDEPLYSDALAVARETMRRAKYNVETIVARLKEMNYDFWETAYSPPAADMTSQLSEFEAEVGVLPLSFRVWHEVVGNVDLTGWHNNWDNIAYDKTWPFYKKQIITDALVVVPLYVSLSLYRDWRDWSEEAVSGSEKIELEIAPDMLHKSQISGLSSFQLEIPNLNIDGIIREPHNLSRRSHQTTFVNHLRVSFIWGGFPGFEYEPDRPTEMLAQLTEGLLPI